MSLEEAPVLALQDIATGDIVPAAQLVDRRRDAAREGLGDLIAGILTEQLAHDIGQPGRLTPEPFDETIEFKFFDYWHYFGRTAKHGAFMGGADFVQWHGNYELLALSIEIEEMASEIRARAAHGE